MEQKAEQSVKLLVEELYNSLQALLVSVAAVERSERFATEYLRAKQLSYREGLAISTDVVDAVLNLSRARIEMAQTAFDFDVALARLLEASGMSEEFEQYSLRPTVKLIF